MRELFKPDPFRRLIQQINPLTTLSWKSALLFQCCFTLKYKPQINTLNSTQKTVASEKKQKQTDGVYFHIVFFVILQLGGEIGCMSTCASAQVLSRRLRAHIGSNQFMWDRWTGNNSLLHANEEGPVCFLSILLPSFGSPWSHEQSADYHGVLSLL